MVQKGGASFLDQSGSVVNQYNPGLLSSHTRLKTALSGIHYLRPGSDADLFMSRTQFEFGPTQINQSMPVDSDAELN